MGFFDKVKKKAQETVGQFAGQGQEPQGHAAPPQQPDAMAYGSQPGYPPQQAQAPQSHAPQVPSFEWDGDVYPLPTGWDNLSLEDWMYKHEVMRDRMMYIDNENVQPMVDADGDPLDVEEAFLIQEYGFASGGAYEAYRGYMCYHFAQQTGQSWDQFYLVWSSKMRERIMAEKANAMRGGAGGAGGGLLDPVEGVSLEQWAQIQAALAGGGNVGQLLAQAGIDQPRWDRVSAEWMSRMSSDTTATIATVYGNAFSGAGQGQFSANAAQAVSQGVGGDVGAEPIPFERYCEIMVAQDAAARRGEDAVACLQQFGLSPLDWSNIGAYWSKRTQQDPMHYHQLMTQYQAQYEGQYGIGDGLTQEQREVVVVNEILDMAGSGRANQLIAYLQNRFPDDAQDYDALDWWMGAACDKCAETGDRNRAQQILWARFPLQDDQSEGVEAYIQSEMDSLF